MDTSKIGTLAASFMDIVEGQELTDTIDPDSLELGEIVITGEMFWCDKQGNEHSCVITGSTTSNRIHQTGILRWGLSVVGEYGTMMEGEYEDDGEEDS